MPVIQASISASDIIAVCAVIVAILALGATFWQAHTARIHNRLSVAPYLDYLTSRVHGDVIEIQLRNNGLGPALVDSISIAFDKTSYDLSSGTLPTAIENELNILSFGHSWGSMAAGTSIAAGQTLQLLSFHPEAGNTVQNEHAVQLLNRFKYTIKYKSIYLESFKAET